MRTARRAMMGAALTAALHLSCASPPESLPAVDSTPVPQNPQDPDIRRVLDSYFASWSAGDMATYRSLFHDKAVIVATAGGIAVYSLGVDEFVRMQEKAQAARIRTERMTSLEVRGDSMAAVARVEWLLTGGPREMRGVDLFTLMRDHAGAWRITHLLFYGTD
ncbi:nuclear transport factor 2 family protein [Candidatus Fermentibacteria bacterium]|nr:nuclear transport factor 2 family protein [Candidatus Fermentibacteria bacterium]